MMKRRISALLLAAVMTVGLSMAATPALATSGSRDTRFLTADEIAAQGQATTTTTTGSTSRDQRFLTPEEIAKSGNLNSSGANSGNRNRSFLTAGEIPKDQNGNPLNVAPVGSGGTAKVVNCKSWVNVRSGPGTNNKIQGQANLGDTLTIIEWDSTNTWANVYYNGKGPGWIHKDFIGS